MGAFPPAEQIVRPCLAAGGIWIFGHHHGFEDSDVDGRRLIRNALGYGAREDLDSVPARPDFVIEVGGSSSKKPIDLSPTRHRSRQTSALARLSMNALNMNHANAPTPTLKTMSPGTRIHTNRIAKFR